MVEHTQAPAAATVNQVEIKATGSPIESVSLYSVGGRAEVKRHVPVQLKSGHNEVTITDVSSNLIEDSLTVSGAGESHAVIHSVTVGDKPFVARTTSDKLEALEKKERALVDQVDIKKNAYNALKIYAESFDTQHIKSPTLAEDIAVVEQQMQDRAVAKRDLDEQIRLIGEDIATERSALSGSDQPSVLNKVLRIAVVAEEDGEVNLSLVYAVTGTKWSPTYTLRVSTVDNKVKVGYKAIISQETGEPWSNVALTLETSQPTQGAELPILQPQRLSLYKPDDRVQYSRAAAPPPPGGALFGSAAPMAASFSAEAMPPPPAPAARKRAMVHAEASVQATGASTSFTIPGRPSIPPDATERTVTIAELELDAVLSRAAVPKRSTLCHLRAQIRNTSQYILLAGPANVTLDGAFVAKTRLTTVHPSETFHCGLGADATVRLTYGPLRQHASSENSFFGVSTTSKTQSRRIDVKNAGGKKVVVIIYDQVPVPEANKIAIECITPALGTPPAPMGVSSGSKSKDKVVEQNEDGSIDAVGVLGSKGTRARWAYVDEGSHQQTMQGEEEEAGAEQAGAKRKKEVNQEGRIHFETTLMPGESTAIDLAYKVTWPTDDRLIGL